MRFIILVLIAISFSTYSSNNDEYTLEFGLVLHNDIGDPIGFKETTTIPLDQNSLFGVVITRDNEDVFKLGSVHVLPKNPNNWKKIIGKNMQIEKKGAVFMRTSQTDPPGVYLLEIYIDNILYQTIEYKLVESV